MAALSQFRSEFPVMERVTFLDHAAVAPLPSRTVEAMTAVLRDIRDNGVLHKRNWKSQIAQARERAAKMLNCTTGEIAFVRNTTEGILFVANGIQWRRGDNVVIPNVEFPANVYPWLSLSKRGVETRFVKEKDGRIDFDDIVGTADSRTRCISLSFVEFCSGFRNDLARIGEFCRKEDILFCVDAIQGLGALQIDVSACGVDFLSADGHKWLVGPEGAGIFFCARDALEKIELSSMGWSSVLTAADYFNYDTALFPDARRFEYGSLNTAGIIGLGASLSLLLEAGLEAIETQVIQVTDHLCDGLLQKGYTIFSSRKESEKSGIVSFLHAAHDSKKIYERIAQGGVVASLRKGRIRISPHFYNHEEDIDKLIGLLP